MGLSFRLTAGRWCGKFRCRASRITLTAIVASGFPGRRSRRWARLSSMLVCGWVAHTGVPNSNSIWAVSLSLSRWCCHCLQAQGSLVLHLQHLPHHEEAGVHLCTRGRERCRSSMAKNILGPEEHQRGIKGQKKCRQVYPAKTSRELKLNHATVSKMCSVQGLGSLVCCALQGGLGCGCDSVGNREYILGRYWTAEKWLGRHWTCHKQITFLSAPDLKNECMAPSLVDLGLHSCHNYRAVCLLLTLQSWHHQVTDYTKSQLSTRQHSHGLRGKGPSKR